MNATTPYHELAQLTDDFKKYSPPWCAITLECMATGTDWDTVGGLLSRLEGYCVSLRIKHRVPRLDVLILDPNHIHDGTGEHYIDGQAGGMLVRAADDNGEPQGPEVFIPYEDIEAIGIY